MVHSQLVYSTATYSKGLLATPHKDDVFGGIDPWEFMQLTKSSECISGETKMLIADILDKTGDSLLLDRFQAQGLCEGLENEYDFKNALTYRDKVELILDSVDWCSNEEIERSITPISHYFVLYFKKNNQKTWVGKEFQRRMKDAGLKIEKERLVGLI